ncbi:MAG TPA: zinc ribbon domain-containing protein [Anaerolineaceae bacterium]|nr:zinc ribbon domain-containing protein [Anaerolineaceae bacterium]
MDFGSVLLILALAVLVGLFISRPLYSHAANEKLVTDRETDLALAQDHERSALLAEHERALAALQELEFDYNLGKIPEEDYPAQRAALLQAGAESLRRLDELQPNAGSGTAEDRIEAAISERRADGRRRIVTGDGPDDEIEQMIAARRRERQEKSAGFCPKCGKPLQKSDRFCSRCGTTISSSD